MAAAARDALWMLFAAALVLGAMFVLPIGGGDMPVVISILNSLTGLAAALTGFVLHNQMLVVAGVLVGASGTLLTLLMSTAMNRSVGERVCSARSAPRRATGAAATAVGTHCPADDAGGYRDRARLRAQRRDRSRIRTRRSPKRSTRCASWRRISRSAAST